MQNVMPWQQHKKGWAPEYEKHVNDLEALVRVQSRPGVRWMTVFAMSGMDEEGAQLLMNTLTSYVRFGSGSGSEPGSGSGGPGAAAAAGDGGGGGGGGSYLVAATSTASLAGCRRLRLPCWNATGVVAAGMAPAACTHIGDKRYCPALLRFLQREGAHGAYRSNGYFLGCWVKVLVVQAVLRALPPPPDTNTDPRGAVEWRRGGGPGLQGVFLSDHDVVYLKRIPDSLDAFFFGPSPGSGSDPGSAAAAAPPPPYDVTAMGEGGGINSGVLAARNTPAVHAMYDAWARLITSRDGDQEQHAGMRGKSWVACAGRGDCPGAGPTVAALARHNTPWAGNGICLPLDRSNASHWVGWPGGGGGGGEVRDHCGVRERLYVHLICLSGGAEKVHAARALGLWLLDGDDPRRTNESAVAAAGLPCAPPADVAQLYVLPLQPPANETAAAAAAAAASKTAAAAAANETAMETAVEGGKGQRGEGDVREGEQEAGKELETGRGKGGEEEGGQEEGGGRGGDHHDQAEAEGEGEGEAEGEREEEAEGTSEAGGRAVGAGEGQGGQDGDEGARRHSNAEGSAGEEGEEKAGEKEEEADVAAGGKGAAAAEEEEVAADAAEDAAEE
ncbi:hypothetical protein HYH02_015097 [Chlamydomonas schloesseri]|uniref:Uncharacterized protein n=1 Tax=Chlamydomonas schloesseri TaxID=2026947 RepID=A0A835SD25_9CHLO|nr:hypothetical protein HYH02_015097 [Chlamydomonas schloesseri]|eukprot:KAG2425048.1 hypothetical protein HYH02_015097 [Chlamydomonas schloesseri]